MPIKSVTLEKLEEMHKEAAAANASTTHAHINAI